MAHAKSVWSHLDSYLIFLCKAFISEAAYILRFWEDMNFGGTNTFQLTTVYTCLSLFS